MQRTSPGPVYPNRSDKTPTERRGVSRRSAIQEAKRRVLVIDLADRLVADSGGGWRKVGNEWVARCPLPDHEDKTPSFTANPARNVWYCHGCLRGGDVIELARFAWGYEKNEAPMAAADVLREFGHPIPERPPSWFARQERQKPIRNAIEDARVEVLMRRLWRWIFEPILADIEDADERTRMGDELWAAVLPLAARLIEDRREAA